MLMHAQGDPKTMNDNPQYSDVVLDVFDYLEERIEACEAAGIPRAKIVADPGIGFGKHLHHNVAVLAALSLYHGLGVPVLLGASRKKLIGQLSDVAQSARSRAGLHRGRAGRRRAGRADHPRARRRGHPAGAERVAGGRCRDREGARLTRGAAGFGFLGVARVISPQDLMGVWDRSAAICRQRAFRMLASGVRPE